MSDFSSPPFNPPPAPPLTTPSGGIGRFTKHMVLGAVFGGLFSSIPLLNCLNLLFCLLNIAGIALALHLYLKSAPGDTVSNGEAAIFGTISGAGAGLIAGLLGLALNAVMMKALAPFLKELGPQVEQQIAAQGAMGLIMVPVNVLLFAGFGALGGFLAMQVFFKARLRK